MTLNMNYLSNDTTRICYAKDTLNAQPLNVFGHSVFEIQSDFSQIILSK